MNLLGDIFLLTGSIFMFLAALGLLRMPDIYTRLQAGTKAATLGSLAILIGISLHHPGWSLKLILIAFFVLLTSPVGSSTIARAAYLRGYKPITLNMENIEKEKS